MTTQEYMNPNYRRAYELTVAQFEEMHTIAKLLQTKVNELNEQLGKANETTRQALELIERVTQRKG